MLCSEGVVIVDSPGVGESHKVLCCVQEGVVIVDSPGVGESNKVSCCVQEGVVIVDRGESQGVMLCSGGRGDSGQPGCPGE